MTEMLHRFLLLFTEEDGASAIEYSLLAGLIAIVIVIAVTEIGNAVVSMLNVVVAGFNAS